MQGYGYNYALMAGERVFYTPERERLEWHPVIDAERIYRANRSPASVQRRKLWEKTCSLGELVGYITCADARIYPSVHGRSIHMSSIAAGGNRNLYSELLKDKSLAWFINATHFAQTLLTTTGNLEGCGGLQAKAKQVLKGIPQVRAGIHQYVEEKIQFPDVIRQSVAGAIDLSKHTEKDVYAAVQDHISGQLFLLRKVVNGKPSDRNDNISDLLNDTNPKAVHKVTQLPNLSPDELPDEVNQYMEAYNKQVKHLHELFPDLMRTQNIQNPKMLIISTDRRPVGDKIADISEKPGTVFRLQAPRGIKQNGKMILPELGIEEVFQQAGYPFSQFDGLKTLYIETHAMDKSSELWKRMSEQPFIQQWLQQPNINIVLGEVHGGEINNIEDEFKNGVWRARYT